uniref:SCP domain-containing protein n=1 Tax=Oreochromis aureus TaxID=47969 RepID=A0AAZ1XP26_OREAU
FHWTTANQRVAPRKNLVAFATKLVKEDEQHHLQTRWTHDNSHLRDMTQDRIHPWMNNAWYRSKAYYQLSILGDVHLCNEKGCGLMTSTPYIRCA